MQVQIKRQIKIELDQTDITAAIAQYLAANDISVSPTELEEISYVKSPKDGLRATLNITEESATNDDAPDLEPQPPVYEPEPEPTPASEDEGPGQVEPSTVEDVLPSVDEIKAMVEGEAQAETTAAVDEENGEVAPQAASTDSGRKSLFL